MTTLFFLFSPINQHPESVIIIFPVIVSLLLVIITITVTTTSYVVSVLFHNLCSMIQTSIITT